MGILMDGGNAVVRWGRRSTRAAVRGQRLPDMDGFQIEDILEVDPRRPRRGLADAAAPCRSIATDLLIVEARVGDRSVLVQARQGGVIASRRAITLFTRHEAS